MPQNKYSFDSKVFWLETVGETKTAHHGYVASISRTGAAYSYAIIDDFGATHNKNEADITDLENDIIDQLNAE